MESVPLWERFLRLATEDGATAFARRYAAFRLANRRSLRMQRRREPWSPAVSAAQAWENAKSLTTFMWANTAGHAWRGVMRTIEARADRR